MNTDYIPWTPKMADDDGRTPKYVMIASNRGVRGGPLLNKLHRPDCRFAIKSGYPLRFMEIPNNYDDVCKVCKPNIETL